MSTEPADDRDGQRAPLLIACLCAAWCRTCEQYRTVFDAVMADLGHQVDARWVDIEDDEDALGGVDVVDFPTLLIARGDHIAFYGPVLPHAQTLRQLADRALMTELGEIGHPALHGLPARLRRL
ncbi:MAG: hypothetical protein RLZZ524_2433 [Pseudomonadota bacterium]|jgi:hypothetical protein